MLAVCLTALFALPTVRGIVLDILSNTGLIQKHVDSVYPSRSTSSVRSSDRLRRDCSESNSHCHMCEYSRAPVMSYGLLM